MINMEQAKLNERTEGLGEWPQWFRNVITKHPTAYSRAVHNQGLRGDVIVGWRRGARLHTGWSRKSPYSMLVLGDEQPPAVEMGIGNIGVEGPLNCFWMSYIHFNQWAVIAEGSRGNLRPWGLFMPVCEDLLKYVIYKDRS